MGTWPEAPKVTALRERPEVAITIDSETFPFQVLMVRGPARVEVVDGVPQEYAAAAERYLGTEAGQGWTAQVGQWFPRMARIAVRPTWVGLLDFQLRFPSGIVQAMGDA
jgi:hypothetical protein